MKILLLTQWFQPEKTFKGLPFAKELVKRGHEVEVLTGFPNYPGGKVYPGYKIKLKDYEEMDGIPVHRVALYPSHDTSTVRRVTNYLSFSASSFVLSLSLVKKPDVIYVYNLVTLFPTAKLLALFYHAPIVLDVQDIWPESVTQSALMTENILMTQFRHLCNLAYRTADQLVVLSPGFKKHFLNMGVPDKKIEIVYNWCNEDELHVANYDNTLANEYGFAKKFNIVFAGNMGRAQALHKVLEAAVIMQAQNSEIQFVFVGGGVEVDSLKEAVDSLNIENVKFIPKQPMNKIGAFIALADVMLVHLKNDPLFKITIPSKIQAYMYYGKPILAAVNGDAADLVIKADCGISCEPGNPESIASKALELFLMPKERLTEMGVNAKKHYDDHLSLRSGVERFDNLFQMVTGK